MYRFLLLVLISAGFAVPTSSRAASTSANIAIAVTKSQAITGVSLSNGSFAGGAPSGTVVGAISVSMSPASPPFSGTLALSGSNASSFQIAGGNLETSGVLPAGTYQVNIVATQAGASGSPLTAAETITGTSSQGGDDPTIGVLPSYNDVYANWKIAGLQSVGGIPTNRTQCGATLYPLANGQDDVTQINNAIASCPAGEVVMLSAGTFTLNEGDVINVNKGITLRGTGTCNGSSSPYCSTLIYVNNGAVIGSDTCGGTSCHYSPAILIGPPIFTGAWNTPTTLTADAAQGATSVTVTSTSGFSVGQWVLVDEASGASWQTDPLTGAGWPSGEQVWAAPDWSCATNCSGSPATGKVAWQKHNPTVSGDDFGSGSYPYQSGGEGCYYSFCDRTTAEIHKITNISGNKITFDSPLTIAYRQSGGHNAQLYSPATPFVTNASVENVSITRSDQGAVVFQFCAYCWAKNVEAYTWLNGGITAQNSARTEINEVYIHNAAWPIPGGAEYAIDLQNATTEMYVVNSISMLAGKAITERSGGAGSVVAYNYMDDVLIGSSPGWQELGVNGSHAAGSHETLFEGNWTFNMDSDDTHGTAVYHTYFRNLATGFRSRFTNYFPGDIEIVDDANNIPGNNGPLRAAGAQYYNYWHAFVGNVLGTSGKTTSANGWSYQNNSAGFVTAIWFMGWRDVSPQPYDPNVARNTFRHGNYDYYNNAVTWDANTSDNTLPNSFYLSGEPSFFTAGSGYPWPWVRPTSSPQFQPGPAGCGGTCSGLPAKARYDAGTPFTQP